jgi:pimeloyl-ACP methyl ester carboxylesterase
MGYSVFLRGVPLGREAITVSTGPDGTTITTQGRLTAPLNLTVRAAEFKYRPDGSPISFMLDAAANGRNITLRTAFDGGMASTEGTQGPNPISVAHPVTPGALIHFNGVFGSYAALSRRLVGATEGTVLRMYVVPQAEIGARVKTVRRERMQIGTSFLDVRRYEVVFDNPGGEVSANLTAAEDGSLVRVSVPAQALDIVREDVASSTSRTQVYSNPGDEPVTIPVTGFNLGATITRPNRAGGASPAGGAGRAARFPAVVLLAGSGIGDRDGLTFGVPTLAQLAGAIAEAGMIAVRYDKRGNGQSGGRAESATLPDFAGDARAVVRWLEKRPDVDRKRIAVVGHSEGAWVGLLAASREKRIAAVVSVAGPSTTGADLILEQQRYALDRMELAPEDRDARIALQKQIQSAVLTGRGWDTVPDELRAGADTPWFQSLLAFDPAKVVEDVRQPLLIVHGALDRQVPVDHAERLADLARKESRSKSIELVIVKGVNHLLVPATTGEVSEYGALPDRNVSPDVAKTTTDWLTRTFAAVR